METKKCPRCKIVKPISSDWSKSSNTKDGCAVYCKNCCRLLKKEARRQKKGYYGDKEKVSRKKYAENHKPEIKEWNKSLRECRKLDVFKHYSQDNISCCKCRFSDMKALSIDHIQGGGAQHKREIGGYGRLILWIIRNGYPEGFQILCLNCQFIKEYETKNLNNSNYKIKLVEHYSDGKLCCKKCNFSDMRALSIDHVKGDGYSHKKEIKINFYTWLINNGFPDGFQVLCMNCQFIKKSDNKEVGNQYTKGSKNAPRQEQ